MSNFPGGLLLIKCYHCFAAIDPCEKRDCGENAKCEAQDGIAVCVCDEGYIMEEGTCVGEERIRSILLYKHNNIVCL